MRVNLNIYCEVEAARFGFSALAVANNLSALQLPRLISNTYMYTFSYSRFPNAHFHLEFKRVNFCYTCYWNPLSTNGRKRKNLLDAMDDDELLNIRFILSIKYKFWQPPPLEFKIVNIAEEFKDFLP